MALWERPQRGLLDAAHDSLQRRSARAFCLRSSAFECASRIGAAEQTLEPHSQPKLELPLTVEVGRVNVQRLPEGCGVGLQAGHEVQRRKRAVRAAGFEIIAGRFQLGYVLVIEKVEALGQRSPHRRR